MNLDINAEGLLVVAMVVFGVITGHAIAAFAAALYRRDQRKAVAQDQRTRGVVALEDPTPDTDELTPDDRAVLKLLSGSTFAATSMVTLPSGRVVTGAEMAALVASAAPDDLAAIVDAVADPRETLGQRSLYDPDAMVPYGVTGQVHLRCLELRKVSADLPCEDCGAVFGRVGSA